MLFIKSCEIVCLIQIFSPHCFNYNKSPSLWCILRYNMLAALLLWYSIMRGSRHVHLQESYLHTHREILQHPMVLQYEFQQLLSDFTVHNITTWGNRDKRRKGKDTSEKCCLHKLQYPEYIHWQRKISPAVQSFLYKCMKIFYCLVQQISDEMLGCGVQVPRDSMSKSTSQAVPWEPRWAHSHERCENLIF